MLRNKNILVTGAGGFLGLNLSRELSENGANVFGLVHNKGKLKPFDSYGFIKKINWVEGDITDSDSMKVIFNKRNFDCCIHLAAQPFVGKANELPELTFKVNVEGTRNMLEASAAGGTGCFIFASTGKAYGAQGEKIICEDAPLLSESPYGASKAEAEKVVFGFSKKNGLPVAITRGGNIYGEFDLNFERIIPNTIRNLANCKSPVIYGDDSSKRDFIYVKDAVYAYMKIIENIDAAKGNAFNIATSRQTPVIECVREITKIMKKDIEPEFINSAAKQEQENVLSIKKAEKILGWKPKYGLGEGLQNTIGWYEEFFKKDS